MLLMLELAAPLWETLHLATFAQFPWRLLSLTTLTMAVLGGAILLVDERPAGTTAQRSLAPAAWPPSWPWSSWAATPTCSRR